MKLMEVCVDSCESALAAAEGGAHRLELCSALSEGGLTPSVGLLKVLKKHPKINIPIFCMLRPRGGNDFILSDEELQVVLYDLEILMENGCDGFVFGSLNSNGEINVEQCRTVMEKIKELTSKGSEEKEVVKTYPVTFHRAFDMTDEKGMFENCKTLENLGFERILTSGFRKNAELGLENLRKLINNESRKIIIVPGAGINMKNLKMILLETKCEEFHASAKIKRTINSSKKNDISMGVKDENGEIYVTDKDTVKEMISIALNPA